MTDDNAGLVFAGDVLRKHEFTGRAGTDRRSAGAPERPVGGGEASIRADLNPASAFA
jgi:hypothetical protein